MVAGTRHELAEPVVRLYVSEGRTVVRTAHFLYWFDAEGELLATEEFSERLWACVFNADRGYTVVASEVSEEDRGTRLYGFDEAGTKRWERRLDYDWALSEQSDGFHIYTQIGKQRHTTLALDPETGALSEVSGPTRQVEEYLDE